MPPRDPNMPEGTDSIIDDTFGTAGATSGSAMSSDAFDAPLGTSTDSFGVAGGAKSTSFGEAANSGFADKIASSASATDVQSLKTQATDKARDFASQGKEKATEALDSVSRMVSETADTVSERLGPQYGDYVRKAAGALDGFNDSIRGKEVDELFDDARNMVRKSPAVAIGAAAAIGFLLVRLVKSGIPQDLSGSDSQAAAKRLGAPPRVDNSYEPLA